MNILILSLEYSPEISGGVGTHVQELSTGLAMQGDNVLVISCTFGKEERWTEQGKTVYLLPPDGAPRAAFSTVTSDILSYNEKLIEHANREVLRIGFFPEIVHCHNWLTYPAASQLAAKLAVPVVATVHYVSSIERRWGQIPDPDVVQQEKVFFRECDNFIAVCRSLRSVIQADHMIPDRRMPVVHNGIDVDLFSRVALSAQDLHRLRTLLAPNGERIILYAGRLHPHKGIPDLLDSATAVLSQCSRVRYVLVGDPDSLEYAGQFRRRLESDPILKARTTVLGKVSRKRLAALYAVADIAVVPSVYDLAPYAAIESMAAGVPLVAANCGGLPEIVIDGQTGFLVPVHTDSANVDHIDSEALCEKTMMLLGNERLARDLAETGRRRASQVFSLEAMVRATRKVYSDTLARSSSVEVAS